MSPADAQQGRFPETTPSARPKATPEQIATLLDQLRIRRRELIHHFAVEAEGDDAGAGAVSAMWPLTMIQAAIDAVEAELAEGRP